MPVLRMSPRFGVAQFRVEMSVKGEKGNFQAQADQNLSSEKAEEHLCPSLEDAAFQANGKEEADVCGCMGIRETD